MPGDDGRAAIIIASRARTIGRRRRWLQRLRSALVPDNHGSTKTSRRARNGAFSLSIVLCASLFLTGCWKGISHEALATALSINGYVTFVSKRKTDRNILHPGATLNAGCSLQLANGAEADFTLLPGVLLRAFDNSDLIIEELKLTKDGDETGGGMYARAATIRLNQGKATLSYEQPEDTSGSLTIITDRVMVNARLSSLFCIETDPFHTGVTCVRGQIDALDATGKRSLIKAGWVQNWSVKDRKSILTRADSAGQSQIDNALQVEKHLRALEPPNGFPIK
jgi:hypothetical protein